jgi:hypothetical protein
METDQVRKRLQQYGFVIRFVKKKKKETDQVRKRLQQYGFVIRFVNTLATRCVPNVYLTCT